MTFGQCPPSSDPTQSSAVSHHGGRTFIFQAEATAVSRESSLASPSSWGPQPLVQRTGNRNRVRCPKRSALDRRAQHSHHGTPGDTPHLRVHPEPGLQVLTRSSSTGVSMAAAPCRLKHATTVPKSRSRSAICAGWWSRVPWAGRRVEAERRDSPRRNAPRRAAPHSATPCRAAPHRTAPPLPWASSEPSHTQHRLSLPPPAPDGRGARAAAGRGAGRAGRAAAGTGRPRRPRELAAWPSRDHRVPTAGQGQSTAGGGALRLGSQWQAAETGSGGPSRRSRSKR